MKKIVSIFLSIVMLISITAGLEMTANAKELTGDCGVNVKYKLDTSTGVLTISGTGKMYDYLYGSVAPWYSDSSSVKTVEIKSGVTSIGDRAFVDCGSLTSITIPDSVTRIGDYAFRGCNSLTSITVDGSNQNYSSQDGVLFNKDKTVLIQYPIGNTRTSYTIPNSVTSIGDNAFRDCDSLTSIEIPNSVTSIGDGAFRSCYSLTSVTIGNSVTSIGNGAFWDCYILTSITIPNSVTSIGDSSFEGCSSLTSIIIPNSVTSIGYRAFSYCVSLKDVYYSGSEEEWKAISIGSYNESLTNATIHYNSTGPENSGGSTGGGGTIGGGGGGGFDPAPTPEEPATTEPTTQPSTKPSAPATTTTKKPSTVKVEKVTKGTKSFKVTWKKKTGVSGYQVQYATDKKFKKNKKTVTIAKKNATSKTIKKLKSKKTYYVRVRTYKIVNGKKVYSSWSKVKAVKTK